MKRFTVLYVLILSVITSSCNLMRKEIKPDGTRNVSLQNTAFSFDYFLGSQPDADNKDSYHQYMKRTTISSLKLALTDLFGDIFTNKNVQEITVYTDTIFNQTDVVLMPQNIKGVQVHYLEDYYLKTHVYTFADSATQKIDPLDSFVDHFTPEALYETSKIFNASKNSIFIFINADITSKYETGKANYDKNLADYIAGKN